MEDRRQWNDIAEVLEGGGPLTKNSISNKAMYKKDLEYIMLNEISQHKKTIAV